MIKRDYDLIVQHDPYDPTYGDGGDSSRSTGIMATFGSDFDKLKINRHYVGNGLLVRHPKQHEWDRPNNFSRDQLIPILSGLAACKDDYTIKKIFLAHLKRGFFCQNYDLTNPAVIGQMILGAKLWYLYPFLIVSYLWHFIEILFNAYVKPDNEQNQIMCQCMQFKTVKIYKHFFTYWEDAVHEYWSTFPFRDQQEIAIQIMNNFK